jgi:MFS family permease
VTEVNESRLPNQENHDRYEALRAPGYRPYLLGGFVASIGAEVQAAAIGWELYNRTESALALGFTGLTQFLPVFLFALPAGQTSDHFNRRKIFQCAQLVAASASLLLAWLSFTEGPIPLIFACLFMSGIGRAFSAPARTSLLAQIVPHSAIPNAVTWNSSSWQLANAAGPALGGLILAVASYTAVAYLTSAACALTCVSLLFLVHPQRATATPPARTLSTLLAGVRFVFGNNLLLAAISLDLFAVLLGGATSLLPIYAKDILHVDSVGFGFLRAAPALGAVIMAFALAHRRPMHRPGVALLLAVAGFGCATIIFGLSTSLPLSFLMLLLTGALDNISVVVRGTLMQVLTPDNMRGRVSAVNSLFISSSNELGAYESGQVAAWFGPLISVVSGGIGTIVVVAITAILCPRLVRLGPLRDLKPEATAPPLHHLDGKIFAEGEHHVGSDTVERRPEGSVQGLQEAIEIDQTRRGIES